MSKKDLFVINDIVNFVNYSRSLIFYAFGKSEEECNTSDTDDVLSQAYNLSNEEKEELESVLSFDESFLIIKNLVKQQKNKHTNKVRFVLTGDCYKEILVALNERMTSNIWACQGE